jgi:hypothetical protein
MPGKQDGPGREAEVEPDQPDPVAGPAPPTAPGTLQLPTPIEVPPPAIRARWLVVPALALAVGLGAGFALGSARAGGDPAGDTAARSPVTQPATPPTSVVVQLTATSACLETAEKADRIIDSLVTNKRDRIAELLVAYGVASRQCRRDAFP